MNGIFLVKGTIHRTEYMVDEPTTFEDSRLVVAESTEEAEDRYRRWWERNTIEYSDYYVVLACEAMETL